MRWALIQGIIDSLEPLVVASKLEHEVARLCSSYGKVIDGCVLTKQSHGKMNHDVGGRLKNKDDIQWRE